MNYAFYNIDLLLSFDTWSRSNLLFQQQQQKKKTMQKKVTKDREMENPIY